MTFFVTEQEYSLAHRLCYTRYIMMQSAYENPETLQDAELFVEAYFPDGFHTEDAVYTVC